MTDRGRQFAQWSGVISLIGLLLAVATAAVRAGAMAQSIDQKVDKEAYERDIGQIKGDLRVLRCKVAQDCS